MVASGPVMARPSASRVSTGKVLRELRVASRRGDRAALTVALDLMRTLALSPRYWERYLTLLRNPLARLVDLLVIKQGDRIAHQKGWKLSRQAPRKPPPKAKKDSKDKKAPRRRATVPSSEQQPTLFDL